MHRDAYLIVDEQPLVYGILPAMHLLQSPSPLVPSGGSDPSGQTLSVMVVEDSQATADILGLFFEAEGHRVRVVYDGVEAVKQTLIDPPDLILMDLGLPEMNGLDAVQEIRRQQASKRSVVIALTGFDDDDMLRRCSEHGFDAHIAKPADPQELRRLVRVLFPTLAA